MARDKIDLQFDDVLNLSKLCESLIKIDSSKLVGKFYNSDQVLTEIKRELDMLLTKAHNHKIYIYYWWLLLVLGSKNKILYSDSIARTFTYEPQNVQPSLNSDFSIDCSEYQPEEIDCSLFQSGQSVASQLFSQLQQLRDNIKTKPYEPLAVQVKENIKKMEPVVVNEVEEKEPEVIEVPEVEDIEPNFEDLEASQDKIKAIEELASKLGFKDIQAVRMHLVSKIVDSSITREYNELDAKCEHAKNAYEQSTRALGLSHFATLAVKGELEKLENARSDKLFEISNKHVTLQNVIEYVNDELDKCNPFREYIDNADELSKISISDHAIVRYIERKFSSNIIAKIRAQILNDAFIDKMSSVNPNVNERIYVGDMIYIVQDNNVITCFENKAVVEN